MKNVFVAALVTFIFICLPAGAQKSAADKFYAQGQACMQTMTVQAQKSAISYFSKARVAYDSADKKKQCDAQIAVCRSIIGKLQGGNDRSAKPRQAKGAKRSGEAGANGRQARSTRDDVSHSAPVAVAEGSDTGYGDSDTGYDDSTAEDDASVDGTEDREYRTDADGQGSTGTASQSTGDGAAVQQPVKKNYTADEIVEKYKARLPVAFGDSKSLQMQTVINSSIIDDKGRHYSTSTLISYDLWQKRYLKITSCSEKKYRSGVVLDGEKGWLFLKGAKFGLNRKKVKAMFDAMNTSEEKDIFTDSSWKRKSAGMQTYNGKKYYKVVFTKFREKTIYVALFDPETFLLSYLDNGTTSIEYLKYETLDGNFVCSERRITHGDKLASTTKIKSAKETVTSCVTDAQVDDNLLNPDIVLSILKGKISQPW